VGLNVIHRRVHCLTAWLLDTMHTLRHRNGRPLIKVLGPPDTIDRGGTIAFVLDDPNSRRIDSEAVEMLANRAGLALRSGCFCNAGAAEAAFDLRAEQLRPWFERATTVTYDELRDGLRTSNGHVVGAVRASLGIASTFADVHSFILFLSEFLDREADEFEREV